MKNIIAIDPGASGGMAISYGNKCNAKPMPETLQDIIDVIKCEKQLSDAENTELVCVMEQVSGYAGGAGAPGSAMFNFGRGFGQLEGVIQTLGIRLELVRPQQWIKGLSLGTRDKTQPKTVWKNKLKAEAQRLYPQCKVTLATADALLLLEYYRRNRR